MILSVIFTIIFVIRASKQQYTNRQENRGFTFSEVHPKFFHILHHDVSIFCKSMINPKNEFPYFFFHKNDPEIRSKALSKYLRISFYSCLFNIKYVKYKIIYRDIRVKFPNTVLSGFLETLSVFSGFCSTNDFHFFSKLKLQVVINDSIITKKLRLLIDDSCGK